MAVCENCANEDDELVAVWPEAGGADEAQLWCEPCRDREPHELAAEAEDVEEPEIDEPETAGAEADAPA